MVLSLMLSAHARAALAKGLERRWEFRAEQLGLPPGRRVAAPADLIEVDEVAIGASCPGLRGAIDVVGEHGDGHGERDLVGLLCRRNEDAAACAVLPV